MSKEEEKLDEHVWEFVSYRDGSKSARLLTVEDDEEKPEGADAGGGSSPRRTIEQEFRLLSSKWAIFSIGFLDHLPKLISRQMKGVHSEANDDALAWAKSRNTQVEEIEDKETAISRFSLSHDESAVLAKKLGKSIPHYYAASAFASGSLSVLLSQYEAHIGNLLSLVGRIKPDAFFDPKDTIPASLLDDAEDLEGLRTRMVESKIDDFLHNSSHIEVLSTLEKKFSINLTSDKALISEFTEICQRRHLFAHAGGVVNRRYLNVCRAAGISEEDLPKLGSKLYIDPKYLRRSTARVFLIGYFALHIIWNKLRPDDLRNSHGAILSDSHDFLDVGLTKMARHVTEFALRAPRKGSEDVAARLLINRALCEKYEGANVAKEDWLKRVEEQLRRRDWSIVDPTLSLALSALRENYDGIEEKIEAAKAQGIGYLEFEMWVIFREMRKSEPWRSKFVEKIGG